MFTDARSLWSMGTSAIASINENISTALEKIDAEIDAQDRQLSTRGDEEQLRIDLEQYKALLEDAQMQHFELSKQSRILIAEKEAELMILKKSQSASDVGDSNMDSESSNLKYQKLFAEKMVLESSLKDAQEQLKRTLQERNEYQVMKKTYDELQTRFKNVKADLTSMKVEVDVKEKQKSETIDNLVSEYSKLAAETELYQQQSDLRVAEVLKENEVLVTKMHALEHSINEFADRSISPAPVMSSSVTSAAGLGTPGSKNNSRADLQATPAGSTSEVELKEAKSKIVNLQYDIKEKEVEISRLKAAALTNSAIPVAVATTASEGADVLTLLQEERRRCEEFAVKLSKAQQDLDNQGKDVARLTVEKREADEAGRKYLEQCKRIQAQHDALAKAQRAQEDSNADRAESVGAAKASEQLLQGEIEALRLQLENQRTEHLQALAERDREQQQALDGVQTKHTEEVATLLEQHRVASSGTTAELEASAHQLRAQIAALTTQLTTTAATHVHELDTAQKDSVAQLAALEKEKSDISARLAQTEADMAALKASHEAELQASLSGGDADKQALVSQYMQQIDSLTADLRKAEGELVEGKTSLSSVREQLATATQAQQQEVADLKQSLTDAETAKAGLENQLAQKTEEMVSTKAAHDAQLQASLSGGDAEKQALVAQYVQQIDTLAAEVSQAKEELTQKADAVKGLEEQLAASTTAHDEKIAVLSAELAAAATEKSELAQQLAQKEEAIVNMAITHETELQELQTASATEKQRLVDEHTEQVDVLQKQLAAAEGTLVEKDSELTALQAQLDSAQAEHAAAVENIAQLTCQLAEAVQAQEDQKSAHAEALHAQEAAAQEVLEAERAALNQQLRDVEESIGVLRESHREELLAELDVQSKQLSAEHTAALEQALATAAAEAASSQAQVLGDQKQALEEDFATQAAAAKELAEAEKASALESNTATLQAEKETALASQASAHAESLSEALVTLTAEKDTEREAALVALAQEKQQDMEAALEECEQAATALLETAQAEHAEKAAAMNAEIDALKEELAAVEAKHQELTSAALAELNERRDQEQDQALTALRQELKALVDAAYKERDEHLENYSKERKLRKKIHNRLLEVQGNIRVLCRVRPILEVERRSGEDVDVTEVPNEEELFVQRDQQTSSQEEVFEAVQPLCVSVLDGYNVCIFAYGQTGSGKTFTMEGSSDNRGVSPRAIAELLSQVEQLRETSTYSLTLSMLEIYNETILDLLPLNASAKEKEKLDIRQTADGNVVVGLTETTITSMAQVEELMKQGQKNRAVGSHDMNEHSSRSHSIITVTCRGKNLLDNTTSYGKLHLIDLAGSERVGKTDATGDRLKEAQNINKSLSALGEVINALGNKKATHVPYRNSKLTFLLQDSLGGNSKVLTFVNISPAVYNLGETVCSLNFATRCRTTELGQAKKQTGPTGEESATKGLRRVLTSSSTSSLNSSAVMTPAAKR